MLYAFGIFTSVFIIRVRVLFVFVFVLISLFLCASTGQCIQKIQGAWAQINLVHLLICIMVAGLGPENRLQAFLFFFFFRPLRLNGSKEALGQKVQLPRKM